MSAAWRRRFLIDGVADRPQECNGPNSEQNMADIYYGKGKETPLLRHFYAKCIILPRQARDKHRDNSKKEWRFPLGLASKELYDEIYETCK